LRKEQALKAYELMLELNSLREPLSAERKAEAVKILLAARSSPEQARRFHNSVRYPGNTGGMYPQFFIPPYNNGRKLRTVTGQLPKTHILSANMYELEILRLLHICAPDNPDVFAMISATLARLRKTCFAGHGCAVGECFDTSVAALKFIQAAAPHETEWIQSLRDGWHAHVNERKRPAALKKYFESCESV
jgi:hypothetical protein